MKLIAVASAILLVVTVSSAKELIQFSLSSYILPDKKLEMELDVVTPRSPTQYPVIVFLTGLSGLAPSAFQKGLIKSVAEQTNLLALKFFEKGFLLSIGSSYRLITFSLNFDFCLVRNQHIDFWNIKHIFIKSSTFAFYIN